MKRKLLLVGAGVLLLLVGIGIGAGGGSDTDTTGDGARVETVTVTEEAEAVARTPEACLEALDLAGEALGNSAGFSEIMSEYAGVTAEAFEHAAVFDTQALNRDTRKIRALNERMTRLTEETSALADPLGAASAECRAGAE